MHIKQEVEQKADWLAEDENVEGIKNEEVTEDFLENDIPGIEPFQQIKKEPNERIGIKVSYTKSHILSCYLSLMFFILFKFSQPY